MRSICAPRCALFLRAVGISTGLVIVAAIGIFPVFAGVTLDADSASAPSAASRASRQWAKVDIAAGGAIRGSVELMEGPRQSVNPSETSDAVVYFLPKAGAVAPKPQRFTVDTRSKGFNPTLLVAPVGSTVAFENSDTILHNVFSRSGANGFDLGFYGPGQTREHTFARTGLVVVNCSVHQNMRANVLLLGTPYFTRPDKKGRFRIDGVPSGTGTLVIWHPRGAPISLELDGPANVPKQRIIATKSPLDPNAHEGHGR